MGKVIIDVRQTDEYASGHVPGAVNIPLTQIMSQGLPVNVGDDDQIIVYCNSGNRSGAAKQILQKQGYKNVVNGINRENIEKNQL